MAMLALGVLWRAVHAYFIGLGEPPPAAGFIYVILLSKAMTSIEVGFVVPYATLVRLTATSLLVFLVLSTARSKGSVGTINTIPSSSQINARGEAR